jgi:hypothetical protein
MSLGWNILLPMALVQIVMTAVVGVLLPVDRYIAGIITFLIGAAIVVVVAARNSRPSQAGRSVTLVKKTAE